MLFDAAERQRRTVRPALPHGPTALPAVLKETQQRALWATWDTVGRGDTLIGPPDFDFL